MNQIYRPIPFFMMYPLDHEEMVEKDARYFQSLYPQDAKKLQRYIEEALEQQEYAGSRIYDAYPDRLMLRLIAADVKRRAKEIEGIESKQDMIEVMLYHEIWRRRNHKGGNIFKF